MSGASQHKIGLGLLIVVACLWVGSSELIQDIYTGFSHPFLVTYLSNSLFVLYLPVSLINGMFFKRPKIKDAGAGAGAGAGMGGEGSEDVERPPDEAASVGGDRVSPRRRSAVDAARVAAAAAAAAAAAGAPPKGGGGGGGGKAVAEETDMWAAMRVGVKLAPVWLAAQYLCNKSLLMTSVASTTIISSTAGLFTLLLGAALGEEALTAPKVAAVAISFVGVVLTAVADNGDVGGGGGGAAEAGGGAGAHGGEDPLWGDLFGVMSAVVYAFYTVLFKKLAGRGEADGTLDTQQVFGFLGLATWLGLWWVGLALAAAGWEPPLVLPATRQMQGQLLINGLVGTVLSDYLWAVAVLWTTPLVATLGLSLTIPVAMVADMVLHGKEFGAWYIVGTVGVLAGFLLANKPQ